MVEAGFRSMLSSRRVVPRRPQAMKSERGAELALLDERVGVDDVEVLDVDALGLGRRVALELAQAVVLG